MVVEPCYPLFSAELESAEALASSQQKFQTLNLEDYKVIWQLLPMTLVCHPTCLGSMVSNPDRTSDFVLCIIVPIDSKYGSDKYRHLGRHNL